MTGYDDYGMPVGAYAEPESLTHQAYRVARAFVIYRAIPAAQQIRGSNWSWRKSLSLVKVLIVVWFITLYWGERSVFKGSVDHCRWEQWEKWDASANPHRLIFVADPQLVDPHTYPGRPWPLDTLTVKHTDLYMRRTYSRMQKILYPDTVIFLGDLFDGGREWSTRTTTSPEAQYRKYGDSFWLREYARFGNIFFGHWGDGGLLTRRGQEGRKIISSLPGNHDLGFGKGIQSSVRKRFEAYFGHGNRVDVLGNHTFVSIDSVSLSALGQENPESVKELWSPTAEFLGQVKGQKQRLVHKELRRQQGFKPDLLYFHDIVESSELPKAQLPQFRESVAEFPTILLTHVPLYREEGTPCGPLREHWPPTPPPKGQTEPLEKDDRNAIAVRGGYQYQNVMHRDITKDIAEKIGDLQYAFSGDDHDYCEVVHRSYPSAGSGIREITVKSISWAMGVRKPGVLMVSMWNPVDNTGKPLATDASAPTLQTHLCLLPDQLAIFIRYATLFGLTIISLAIRAGLITSGRIGTNSTAHSPILPTAEHEKEKAELSHQANDSLDATSSNSSTSTERAHLQVRNAGARTRSVSPSAGYALPTPQSNYAYPLIQHAGYYGAADESKMEPKSWSTKPMKKKTKKTGCGLFIQELRNTVFFVGVPVFAWYFWLIRN
ncbi:hypothetical protein BDV96DRAFT_569647 [Lophiotrema nucula]|uniref:Uncharacterized protein n=1 Tax=Lophiotrema nucula TaxID=690887 RepID=A0A6A5ZGT5_9PLEO|nr:hypothetical protein BDV96DRAFT_569647 [Lophiotrema nucula]